MILDNLGLSAEINEESKDRRFYTGVSKIVDNSLLLPEVNTSLFLIKWLPGQLK